MQFFELIEKNNKLTNLKKKKYNVLVVSNLTINPLKEYLEFKLRSNKLNAFITFGNYNTFIYDTEYLNNFDCIIFFWDFINIIEQNISLSRRKLNLKKSILYKKIITEIDLSLKNIDKNKLVLFNNFTDLPFKKYYGIQSKEKFAIVSKINNYLHKKNDYNFYNININEIFKNKIENFLNFQSFEINKSFYSLQFYEIYSQKICEIIIPKNNLPKKVIILDCDNTLWPGIVGEPDNKKNKNYIKIFNQTNKILKKYKSQGILLALCSKNNFQDVKEYFHSKNIKNLKFNDFIIKKINWIQKHLNINEIAKELNLGLDSFIFIDDSNYEISLINKYLPEVLTLQVPKDLSQFPYKIHEIRKYFSSNISNEDSNRTKMYSDEKNRLRFKSKFKHIDTFLKSLSLQLKFYVNNRRQSERISQMTLKTNQFNLTTKRYSINDIKKMFKNNYLFFTFSLSDKFGDYGITGLSIVKIDDKNATIDSYLLSCRVLTRNVEYAFFYEICKYLKKLGINNLNSSYIPTNKNKQVEYFYENVQFDIKDIRKKQKIYYKDICKFKLKKINYIKVNYEKSNK